MVPGKCREGENATRFWEVFGEADDGGQEPLWTHSVRGREQPLLPPPLWPLEKADFSIHGLFASEGSGCGSLNTMGNSKHTVRHKISVQCRF